MDRAAKLFGVAALFGAFIWTVTVAPFVGSALAIVIAIAWCVFLERRTRGSARVGGFVLLLCLPGSATAQTGTPAAPKRASTAEVQAAQPTDNPWRNVSFGGTFEGYGQYNWNRPPGRSLVLRAYDTRRNTFGIQQVR
jgi:hypothetical protein